LLSTACATADTPELVAARSAISDAESAGAAQSAPAELASARDRLARAEAEQRKRHYDEASFLAEQAEAAARLAAVKSRAAAAEVELRAIGRGEPSGAGGRPAP
jgi:hypothetical protein